jgi:hypothetical protein
MKHHLGNVGFATRDACGSRPCAAYAAEHPHMHRLEVMGQARVDLLQATKNGWPLPEGTVLVVNHPGGPWNQPIGPDEVDWTGLR